MGVKRLPEQDEQQLNKDDEQADRKAKQATRSKKERRRIFPIWLRIIVFFVLAFVALATGLMFGYSVMGDGNATDVFKTDTWHHIIDIVTKE